MSASGGAGRVVYMNGELVPEGEARISIYDSALRLAEINGATRRNDGYAKSRAGDSRGR